ncbi:MAG: antibiotic biosynthesis monooxygenase [Lewinella sp.]|nr:antibiotic biosynthesis monooxygenase [Lewinella sp.]
MVLEIAMIEVKPGSEAAFEDSLAQAQSVISRAKGYLGHEFHHCLERQNGYVLLIRWASLEAHTEGFRQSPLFQEWRALIGPHFAQPPVVEHYEVIGKR